MPHFLQKKQNRPDKGKLICTAGHIHAYNADAEWLLASKDQWSYMIGSEGAGSASALPWHYRSVGAY